VFTVPAWILTALRLLGIGAAAGAVSGALGDAPGEGIPFLPAIVDPFQAGGLDLFSRKAGGKRHRRRRALTQGDRDDIAFITGMLGAPAGKQFALTLAGRSR